MKINKITLWQLPLTSHTPYYMADGKSCETVTSTIVRLSTDSDIEGWGEVCPIPHYLPAYAAGVIPAIAELAPVILGGDPLGVDALMAKINRHLKGHEYAKSAVDIALWDITAKAANLPLYQFLGGRQNTTLPLYHSISCLAPEEMAAIAKDALATGIKQFQVKLGADGDWEKDVERMQQVRHAVGHGYLVYGDWNCGANRLDAIRVGRALRQGDFMLEQPCPTLEDCAAVKQTTALPMKIDENAHDTASLLKAHQLGCLDAVAIKLSKFGGITQCRQARDLCLHLGAKMCIEDVWGSDITTMASLHLGISTPARALLNCCDLAGYVSPRLDQNCPVRHNGSIAVPDTIGIGVSPNLELLGNPAKILQ